MLPMREGPTSLAHRFIRCSFLKTPFNNNLDGSSNGYLAQGVHRYAALGQ